MCIYTAPEQMVFMCHRQSGLVVAGGRGYSADAGSIIRIVLDLTCKRGSVGQSKGLLIPRSSV